jgi:hypothetical protein
MNDRPLRIVTLESLVIGVLLIAGMALRVGLPSWPPLTPAEAASALDAARSTQGASALDPSSGPVQAPAYASLTALLFTAFGASDALARVVPMMAGIALLALPLVLRRLMGPAATTLATLLLAVSPALVMTARTAGGGALAIAALSFCFALLLRDDLSPRVRTAWMAILLALGVASGPSALNGLLGLGLGLVLHRLLFRSSKGAWASLRALPWSVRRELVLFVALLLVFSTALGTRLDGIAGVTASIAAWIKGWAAFGALALGPALVGLLVYEPLVLAGSIYGAIALRSHTRINSNLLAWALGALVVMVIYPGRSVTELAWWLVPLALLAGQAIEDVIERAARADNKPVLLALIGILLLLSAFAYLQLAAYVRGIGLGAAFDPSLGLGLAVGALVLGIVVAGLFGLGWSWTLPGNAVRVVGVVLLMGETVSALWSLNYIKSVAGAQELWRPQAATVETRLLHETVRGVSLGQTGTEDSLPLRLEEKASPVLAWTLRDFPLDAPQGALASDRPAVILRRVDGQDRPLAADYVGQTFSVGQQRAWGGILPAGILHWLILRDGATTPEQWLLLVRADVAGFGESPVQTAPEAGAGG